MKRSGRTIKDSRFPLSLFAIYYGVLFLMSGIQSGLVTLGNSRGWNEIIQVIIPMIYWGAVAAVLTWFTRRKIRSTYEEPMHKLADATTKVANGDFSVYVPALHTPDKLDYLDVMLLDFNKMVAELGSIETLKTDFVSNVSHEMKTPIAVIKNYAELLQMDSATELQKREYAQAIENAAQRLSNMISNILKLNKLENQRITPELENYDVCRQLCECILQFEEAWDEKGCGMSRESMRHIFDKFYQGDTSHSKEGNGLGLALVKRVLELMDGEILVESEEGKGSTFTVKLPLINENGIYGGEE